MQWHPLFARLLRPVLEAHYEVQTTVPVGDLPREADIVLLRRASSAELPFQGLWRWLTSWNVLEIKGPNASARLTDLDSLIELGLGVQRRLDEQQTQAGQPRIERDQMSWWYLVPSLGQRFLREAPDVLGQPLEALTAGLWRVRLVQGSLFLVSGREVQVDRDSLPMHALFGVPEPSRSAAAAMVSTEAPLLSAFGGWLSLREPVLWQEIVRMAAERGEQLTPDLRPLVELLGEQEVSRQLVEQVDPRLLLERLGTKRVLSELGAKQVVSELGVEGILAGLPPEQQKELLRRLQETHQTEP